MLQLSHNTAEQIIFFAIFYPAVQCIVTLQSCDRFVSCGYFVRPIDSTAYHRPPYCCFWYMVLRFFVRPHSSCSYYHLKIPITSVTPECNAWNHFTPETLSGHLKLHWNSQTEDGRSSQYHPRNVVRYELDVCYMMQWQKTNNSLTGNDELTFTGTVFL